MSQSSNEDHVKDDDDVNSVVPEFFVRFKGNKNPIDLPKIKLLGEKGGKALQNGFGLEKSNPWHLNFSQESCKTLVSFYEDFLLTLENREQEMPAFGGKLIQICKSDDVYEIYHASRFFDLPDIVQAIENCLHQLGTPVPPPKPRRKAVILANEPASHLIPDDNVDDLTKFIEGTVVAGKKKKKTKAAKQPMSAHSTCHHQTLENHSNDGLIDDAKEPVSCPPRPNSDAVSNESPNSSHDDNPVKFIEEPKPDGSWTTVKNKKKWAKKDANSPSSSSVSQGSIPGKKKEGAKLAESVSTSENHSDEGVNVNAKEAVFYPPRPNSVAVAKESPRPSHDDNLAKLVEGPKPQESLKTAKNKKGAKKDADSLPSSSVSQRYRPTTESPPRIVSQRAYNLANNLEFPQLNQAQHVAPPPVVPPPVVPPPLAPPPVVPPPLAPPPLAPPPVVPPPLVPPPVIPPPLDEDHQAPSSNDPIFLVLTPSNLPTRIRRDPIGPPFRL